MSPGAKMPNSVFFTNGGVAFHQGSLQEFSADHHFVVGPIPAVPAIIALMGFSGHGFKFASAIGEAAADFAIDGGTRLPVSHLTADRFLGARS